MYCSYLYDQKWQSILRASKRTDTSMCLPTVQLHTPHFNSAHSTCEYIPYRILQQKQSERLVINSFILISRVRY